MESSRLSVFAGRKVLVTGGTGLIGIPLVRQLLNAGARVYVATLDPPERIDLLQERAGLRDVTGWNCGADLTKYEDCCDAVDGMEYVFQLAGSKGSVGLGIRRGATFFESHVLININMLKAAAEAKVGRYLLTSTVGVYSPAAVYQEDHAWDGLPNQADRYGGWAKRMAELFAEAVKDEYGFNNTVIVRPGNVYGPWDNFDAETAMAVAAIIGRVVGGEDPLKVWGDGSAARDFTYAEDIAWGMRLAMELAPPLTPINLSAGEGYSVKRMVKAIMDAMGQSMDSVQWDTTKPSGEPLRILDITRARNLLGFSPKWSLEDGIAETVAWYVENRDIADLRYNVFK